jgi:hypothetical protein
LISIFFILRVKYHAQTLKHLDIWQFRNCEKGTVWQNRIRIHSDLKLFAGTGFVSTSVADPGCLSQFLPIPDPKTATKEGGVKKISSISQNLKLFNI